MLKCCSPKLFWSLHLISHVNYLRLFSFFFISHCITIHKIVLHFLSLHYSFSLATYRMRADTLKFGVSYKIYRTSFLDSYFIFFICLKKLIRVCEQKFVWDGSCSSFLLKCLFYHLIISAYVFAMPLLLIIKDYWLEQNMSEGQL